MGTVTAEADLIAAIWIQRICALMNQEATMYVMKRHLTAVVKQDEGWWIGWVEEIPGINFTRQNS